jgi:hypothetical protein
LRSPFALAQSHPDHQRSGYAITEEAPRKCRWAAAYRLAEWDWSRLARWRPEGKPTRLPVMGALPHPPKPGTGKRRPAFCSSLRNGGAPSQQGVRPTNGCRGQVTCETSSRLLQAGSLCAASQANYYERYRNCRRETAQQDLPHDGCTLHAASGPRKLSNDWGRERQHLRNGRVRRSLWRH